MDNLTAAALGTATDVAPVEALVAVPVDETAVRVD